MSTFSPTVKHTLQFFLAASSGIPNYPEFVGAVQVDGVLVAYCNTNTEVQPRGDWGREVLEDDPQLLSFYGRQCEVQPSLLKDNIKTFEQLFNQSGGTVCEVTFDLYYFYIRGHPAASKWYLSASVFTA